VTKAAAQIRSVWKRSQISYIKGSLLRKTL
jgi:hypothetical protein